MVTIVDRLPADEVHVWHLGADDRTAAGVSNERLLELLSAPERERHARFVFARDRDRFLLAHAATRLLLGRYGAAPAASLAFTTNQYGRPEIVAPESLRAVRFNLSHTRGLIAVAVCLRRDVGVDVEWHACPMTDRQALADRFFAPSEAASLASAPAAAQPLRFFHYWTLKESYIKARGLGLAIPLDSFSFELDPPRISIDPSQNDGAHAWRFLLDHPTAEHALAAAVRAGRDPIRFVVREVTVPQLYGGAAFSRP